jgi:hypothetical protein
MNKLVLALLLIVMMPVWGLAQSGGREDPWASFRFFLGSWIGKGKGQPGTSQVEREYQFVLNGQFLQVRSRSVYQPQEKNPKGEVHEDVGFFSYDHARKQHALRQFHVEGFVSQYRLERTSDDKKTIVFVSESIENIASGWRARETYRIVNEDEFTERFELAGPGKDFELYTENTFRRKK